MIRYRKGVHKKQKSGVKTNIGDPNYSVGGAKKPSKAK